MENQASLLEQMTVFLWLVEWVSIIELERVKTKEISNSEQGSSHEYFFGGGGQESCLPSMKSWKKVGNPKVKQDNEY